MNLVFKSLLIAVPFSASISGCIPQEPNTPSLLEGHWLSNCYYDSDENEYVIDNFRYEGDKVTAGVTIYSEASCKSEPKESHTAGGTFELGDEIELASGEKVIEVDYKISYRGNNYHILDIIKLEGNQYQYGVFIDKNVRPKEIDTKVTLTRKK